MRQTFDAVVTAIRRLFIRQGRLFLGDAFARLRILGVDLDVLFPFFRHIVLMENRFDGALGDARFAVDAFFWMYIKHLVALVETFHGTDHYAIRVPATGARFCNHVRHRLNLFLRR